MKRLPAVTSIFVLLFGFVAVGSCQSASTQDGNIYFKNREGVVTQPTSLGLDDDPSLSRDSQLCVFVRHSPSLMIDTGLGETDRNELWIVATSGTALPKRVLVGHSGGFKIDDNLVLAGFMNPQFSPDASRIYFMGQAWATSSPIFILDLTSGKVRFLCEGAEIRVEYAGRYAGFLIVNLKIPTVVAPPRVFRYWLLDPDGKPVGEIGDSKAAVREFEELWNP